MEVWSVLHLLERVNMILMVFPSLRLSYDQHQVFTGTELGSLAGDAVTDHSQEECGHLRCKPADQGPATSGGDTGSADDGNQPSQTDSSSPSTGVSEITGTNGSDDGADTDHDIPHHCMHGHDHVRCVNHTFDIGSSISQVTDIFGPSVPWGRAAERSSCMTRLPRKLPPS